MNYDDCLIIHPIERFQINLKAKAFIQYKYQSE